MSKECEYALYKGDTFIDLGTKKYLANLLKCKIDYITWLASPSHKKRIENNKKKTSNALIAIKIEED